MQAETFFIIPLFYIYKGKMILNALPSPFPKVSGFPSSTFVSTFISPPCALMISYAKLKPKPVPWPVGFVVKNGWKNFILFHFYRVEP
jgi:hypothetical protein